MEFILSNEEAIQMVDKYFLENLSLKPHFLTWLKQLDVKAI